MPRPNILRRVAFLKMVHFIILNIWYVFYILLWLKYGFMGYANHCILILCCILNSISTLFELGPYVEVICVICVTIVTLSILRVLVACVHRALCTQTETFQSCIMSQEMWSFSIRRQIRRFVCVCMCVSRCPHETGFDKDLRKLVDGLMGFRHMNLSFSFSFLSRWFHFQCPVTYGMSAPVGIPML